jgi:GrpB-like predicted nucleotidyltransferase (UPF0157 family)
MSVADGSNETILISTLEPMTVRITPYATDWPDDFQKLAGMLAVALGDLALRIDHIGSTSIPDMDAKDVIDIQVTVTSLDIRDEIGERFAAVGFTPAPYGHDHEPPGWSGDAAEWRKVVFGPPEGMRLCNVHVREAGRANQRYALLFRDYLRSDSAAVRTWIDLKRSLAEQFPDDLSTYGIVKDAATDVLMLAAEQWAERTGWSA